MSLKSEIRSFKNYLVQIGREYHPSIPVRQILERLPEGVAAVDEDGEPWEGLLCGREGTALIDLQIASRAFKTLVVRWYRMGSGKFEVTAYMA
jgi:hypothetical protein